MRIEKALAVVQTMATRRRRRPLRVRAQQEHWGPVPPSVRWTWATATPRERAEFVRDHYKNDPSLTGEDLCDAFGLTFNGLVEIIRGRDWSPDYMASELYADRCEAP